MIKKSVVNTTLREIASCAGHDNYGHDPRDPTKVYNTRFSIYHTIHKRLHNQRYSSPGIQPFSQDSKNKSLGVKTKDKQP